VLVLAEYVSQPADGAQEHQRDAETRRQYHFERDRCADGAANYYIAPVFGGEIGGVTRQCGDGNAAGDRSAGHAWQCCGDQAGARQCRLGHDAVIRASRHRAARQKQYAVRCVSRTCGENLPSCPQGCLPGVRGPRQARGLTGRRLRRKALYKTRYGRSTTRLMRAAVLVNPSVSQ
jgi:hypothetical protein